MTCRIARGPSNPPNRSSPVRYPARTRPAVNSSRFGDVLLKALVVVLVAAVPTGDPDTHAPQSSPPFGGVCETGITVDVVQMVEIITVHALVNLFFGWE